MKKISYKVKLLLSYMISLGGVALLIYIFFTSLYLTDVGKISEKNLQIKSEERLSFFHNYFAPYFTTIKAISQNKTFLEFIDTNKNKDLIEEYFLSIKKSLPCLSQVRYISSDGIEKIRIDGKPLGLFPIDHNSKIVSKEHLQNKASKDYFKSSFQLKKEQIGISNIDLNMEYGKLMIPKQPTVRIAMAVFDSDGDKKGVVILNICLKKLFKLLDKTTLYHVYMIDSEGKFLNHYKSKYTTPICQDNNL